MTTIDTADLSTRRFYGAKGTDLLTAQIATTFPTHRGTHCIAEVTTAASTELYQLVLDSSGRDILDTDLDTPTARELTGASDPSGARVLHGSLPDLLTNPQRTISWRRAGEQSNTSWIATDPATGEGCVVKFFRHLAPGTNPDVELLTALTAAGCTAIAELYAHTTIALPGVDTSSVTALVQEFIDGATDGYDWLLATLTAGDRSAVVAGLTRLGTAVATVHRDLAAALPTATCSGQKLAHRLRERARGLMDRSPQLREYERAVGDVYDRVAVLSAVDVQRVHGDLHLGQTLRRGDEFYLIDFEGEPAATLEQRLAPDSPVRDVAGMVRSFDYAVTAVDEAPVTAAELTATFLAAYTALAPFDPVLLDAYTVDKVLYEVVYEQDNRPHMVEVPSQALARIIGPTR
ncbi:MAG: phosphotransferase [Corynebacterium sp.]|nr:phosphotransferase [Corynebacterium sp.]